MRGSTHLAPKAGSRCIGVAALSSRVIPAACSLELWAGFIAQSIRCSPVGRRNPAVYDSSPMTLGALWRCQSWTQTMDVNLRSATEDQQHASQRVGRNRHIILLW